MAVVPPPKDQGLTRRELLSKARPVNHTKDRTLTGRVSSGIGDLLMIRTDRPLDDLIRTHTPVTITLHEAEE